MSQAGISHAPRIASVLVDGNILKETKEVVFKSENTDGKLEKYHLTNIPLQNVDSPQGTCEIMLMNRIRGIKFKCFFT